ncbi:MAG: AAA family ATPase, partial [Rhodospirillales bacterium]|nr:AAA family ATPase [Rhodospirillales bacterium]
MSPLLEQLDKIEELRRRLWANGYRPVAVASVLNMGRSPGKRAVGGEWSDRARQDPPDAVVSEATADAMNTGILCDGLRVVDIDIDDPQVVAQVLDILAMVLPKTIARSRPNSPKLALVYRAATGQPEKKVVAFSGGKVEILGHGQQFVAFGTHPSGVDLEWKDGSPLTVAAGDLPAALESDIDLLLGLLAQVLGGTAPGDRGEAKQAEPEASLEDVAPALGAIPNDGPANWDFWSRVGMAAWRATGGSEDGFEAWGQWSATHPASDGEAARERWDHWTQSSPPDRIGFGTLVYLARQADPNWQQPSKRPSGGAEFSDVPPGPDPEPEPPPRRRWLKTGSFDWSNSRPSVIDGLLAQRDVGMIFGAPGAGKSLIGPLMAATVALGKPFFGLETTSGATLYVAAEDEAGMIRRAEALSRRHGGLGEFRLSS